MQTNQKQILDNFQKCILDSWSNYRDMNAFEDKTDVLITYLIDCQIIKSTTIRRYTILKEFMDTYPEKINKKTEVVRTISIKYNITARAVWNIIRSPEGKKPMHFGINKYK